MLLDSFSTVISYIHVNSLYLVHVASECTFRMVLNLISYGTEPHECESHGIPLPTMVMIMS